jgi:Ca2+/Na+ antiporter
MEILRDSLFVLGGCGVLIALVIFILAYFVGRNDEQDKLVRVTVMILAICLTFGAIALSLPTDMQTIWAGVMLGVLGILYWILFFVQMKKRPKVKI